MDRLPAVAALFAIAVAGASCEEKARTSEPPAPAGRVNAVKAGPAKDVSAEAFCDVYYPADKAPSFALPAMAVPATVAAGWRWINLWATWCKPCVAEIPRLHTWQQRLGSKVTLVLVSVDEDDKVVSEYAKAHPEITSAARVADPKGLPAWLKTVGLDEAAPIPIHVFVDPQGKTRCARAGGVGEPDFPGVAKLLAE